MSYKKKICPCCEKEIDGEPNDFEICYYCRWQDDGYIQGGGANKVSLEQAKINYKKFGKIEARFIKYTFFTKPKF